MKHIRQSKRFSCGATSYAMILNIPEKEAIKEVKCTYHGTSSYNVENALENRGIKTKRIWINLPYECIFTHLKLLSNQYKIYVSADFVCNSGRGRNSHRRHAFALNQEKIFDPGESRVIDMDCNGHLYNRELIIGFKRGA